MIFIKINLLQKMVFSQMLLQNQGQIDRFLDIILFPAMQHYFFHYIFLVYVHVWHFLEIEVKTALHQVLLIVVLLLIP